MVPRRHRRRRLLSRACGSGGAVVPISSTGQSPFHRSRGVAGRTKPVRHVVSQINMLLSFEPSRHSRLESSS